MNNPDPRGLEGRPVVIGGGLAGLMTALHLAPEPVVLLTKAPLGRESSSVLAQGGVAASIGADDSPALHLADSLEAGDGLCDADVVRCVVESGAEAIEALSRFGVRFDRDREGALSLGLEAAHSRRRIVHAGGDGTGREIVRGLVEAVRRTPSVQVVEGMEARRLVVQDGAVVGVLAAGEPGTTFLATRRVVIATGGVGSLFADSTNPRGSFGQGLALAARAGAELVDLEFVQFHPTALDTPSRPMHLVSEAVRGEGAALIDEAGARFLKDIPGAELAPRDVVARAVASHLARGHHVYLDARKVIGDSFARRFPAIYGFCMAAGIDPALEPIPVRPAAHYHMGGIGVDLEGRTSIEGLWACGEAAATGLHGANRLASNSLLEAAVFGKRVAESLAGVESVQNARPVDLVIPAAPDPAAVRPLVSRALGIVRDGEELRRTAVDLLPMALGDGPEADPAALALMMAVSAERREESRGAHFRSDFPQKAAAAVRSRLTLAQALEAAGQMSGGARLARSA